MRVAQKGTRIVPVRVDETTLKQQRAGASQYIAHGYVEGTYGAGMGGDTIEEAVDAFAELL